jgi:hypothetical protein
MKGPPNQNRVNQFLLLNEQERRDAITKLARSGMGDHAIASITALNVEMIRRILADQAAVSE